MRQVICVVVALLVAGRVNACGCSHPTFGDRLWVTDKSDVVFEGEVQEVDVKTINGIKEVHAKFRVLRVKKDPMLSVITILVSNGGTSCDLPASFKIGERYLISGNKVVWVNTKAREA